MVCPKWIKELLGQNTTIADCGFESRDVRRVLLNYETTLDIAAAMQNSPQLSADHANSSSTCQWSSSIAFSEENNDELVGIGEAREQLVQWLIENDSMLKVIFVHGAQGVGKTSLVGVVLRD
ncbi:hypothetical protein NL676_009759 [Syzygium grande]|nr:hypothetical protein NL676_009759 [Syzygium grande]